MTTPSELERLRLLAGAANPRPWRRGPRGQAADGLAVRNDKLGLELTVDLGFDANNAQNLAAEEQLARVLLARLR